MNTHSQQIAFIWSIAELLRGDYKQSEYGRVVLPFTVLRRLDCVLENTKEAVLAKAQELGDDVAPEMRERLLNHEASLTFHNTSLYDFERLKADPDNIAGNLKNYVNGFPEGIQDIFAMHFKLFEQVDRLEAANLLYQVLERFAGIDLHPNAVNNHQMGTIFEELIRRFSEQSNETAGEHFTPREVIRLMVNLLFVEDREALTEKGKVVTLYDPACGTGGMLSVAEDYLFELNSNAQLIPFGQELNGEAYGICKSDMLIKGADPSKITFGNSFNLNDGFAITPYLKKTEDIKGINKRLTRLQKEDLALDVLSALYLSEKCWIAKQHGLIRMHDGEIERMLKLRNDLAHGREYASTRTNVARLSKTVRELRFFLTHKHPE